MKSSFLQPDLICSHIVCNLKGTCLSRFPERASASRRVSGPPYSPIPASTSPIRASCSPIWSPRLSFATCKQMKSGFLQHVVRVPPEPAVPPRGPGRRFWMGNNGSHSIFKILKKVWLEEKMLHGKKNVWKKKTMHNNGEDKVNLKKLRH